MSRSHKSVTPRKNPTHPSALTANDLTVGRTIIWFCVYTGSYGEFLVLERPQMVSWHFDEPIGTLGAMEVKLREVATGESLQAALTDMGVIPYSGSGWNVMEFTVDARKADLLPEPLTDVPLLDTGNYPFDDAHLNSHLLGNEEDPEEYDEFGIELHD